MSSSNELNLQDLLATRDQFKAELARAHDDVDAAELRYDALCVEADQFPDTDAQAYKVHNLGVVRAKQELDDKREELAAKVMQLSLINELIVGLVDGEVN